MFNVLESEIITLILSKNYDSNISRQFLNSFKSLTKLSIFWSSAPLIKITSHYSLVSDVLQRISTSGMIQQSDCGHLPLYIAITYIPYMLFTSTVYTIYYP